MGQTIFRKSNPNFINLCLNENLSSKITLQPLKRFDLDAAIIFSDILMIPYGLNQKVEFKKNFGPILGDLNLDIRQRMKNVDEFLNKMSGSDESPLSNTQKHRRETEQGVRGEGGALAYVIDTPKGRILWKDSPGHWRGIINDIKPCLLYTSPSPRDGLLSRMPSSA